MLRVEFINKDGLRTTSYIDDEFDNGPAELIEVIKQNQDQKLLIQYFTRDYLDNLLYKYIDNL